MADRLLRCGAGWMGLSLLSSPLTAEVVAVGKPQVPVPPVPPAGTVLLGSWQPSFDHPTHPCNPALPTPSGFNSIHTSVIPVDPRRPSNPWGGKVLVWDESNYLPNCNALGGDFYQRWAIVDPATQSVQTYAWRIPAAEAPPAFNPNVNGATGNQGLFCAGHCWLRDGRLLVAGGNDWSGPPFVGSQLLCVFDPWATSPATAWSVVKDTGAMPIHLRRRRWYPSLVRLADDRDTVAIFGGVETWDFSTNMVNPAEWAHKTYEAVRTRTQGQSVPWERDNRAGISIGGQVQSGLFGGPQLATSSDELYYYPRMHLLSRQALQNARAQGVTWMSGMVTESAWVEHANTPMIWPQPRPVLGNGSNILFEPASVVFPNISPAHEDLVVVMGGEIGPMQSPQITNQVWMLSGRQASPAWTNLPGLDLLYRRKFHKAVLLPDTSVLLVGGGWNGVHGGAGQEVFWPEVFLQGQWRYCAKEVGGRGDSPRTYHSCAVLLPSGEVLSCGGNTRNVDYQVFRPHYFDGQPKPPKFVAGSLPPATITYGQTITFGIDVPMGLALDRVVLTTPGSITHAQDPGQRCIQLAFQVHDSGNLVDVTAPPSATHAIPGCYMLWLVSSAGVPSVAHWVFLE